MVQRRDTDQGSLCVDPMMKTLKTDKWFMSPFEIDKLQCIRENSADCAEQCRRKKVGGGYMEKKYRKADAEYGVTAHLEEIERKIFIENDIRIHRVIVIVSA